MRIWPVLGLLAIILVLALALLPGAFGSGLRIDTCQEVAESVSLSSNLKTDSTCLKVTKSNLVIDCGGHTIAGPGVTNTGDGRDTSNGILMRGVSNITIANCTFSGLDYGIFAEAGGNFYVYNNHFSDFFQTAFYSDASGEVEFTDNIVDDAKIPDAPAAKFDGTAVLKIFNNQLSPLLSVFYSIREKVMEVQSDDTFDSEKFEIDKNFTKVTKNTRPKRNQAKKSDFENNQTQNKTNKPLVETNQSYNETNESITSVGSNNETNLTTLNETTMAVNDTQLPLNETITNNSSETNETSIFNQTNNSTSASSEPQLITGEIVVPVENSGSNSNNSNEIQGVQ